LTGRPSGEIRKLTSLLEASQALANATNFKASLHRVLEIRDRVLPVRLAEYLASQHVLREELFEAIQPHHFGVPRAHHVQRPLVPRVEPQRLERVIADLHGVLHAVALA